MEMTTAVQRTSINPKKFALWVGMASIVMMFAAFTSAYIVKQSGGNWLEFTLPNIFYVSTALILGSSLAIHLSYGAYKAQNEGMYKIGLVIAFILGIGFLISQYVGWTTLLGQGIDMKANVSGAFTYLITGAHAVHILSGLAAMLVALIHAFTLKFNYTERRKNRFELVVQYWHFLDFLWIYLLIFMLTTR